MSLKKLIIVFGLASLAVAAVSVSVIHLVNGGSEQSPSISSFAERGNFGPDYAALADDDLSDFLPPAGEGPPEVEEVTPSPTPTPKPNPPLPPTNPPDALPPSQTPIPSFASPCQAVDGGPSAAVPVTREVPTNLRVVAIKYLPALQLAAIDLDWEEPPGAACWGFEILSASGTEFRIGFPSTPAFAVPGNYCFRVFSGDATGRSPLSDQMCVDLDIPPVEECAVDPHFGENTVCELTP